MGHVYVLTHEASGKVYVGQTRKTLDQRWYAHLAQALKADRLTPILAALRENPSAFSRRVVFSSDRLEELLWVEGYWIQALRATDPEHGFNRKTSGLSCSYSEEARQRMSEAQRGERGPMAGRQWTQERRKKAEAYARAPTRAVIEAAARARQKSFRCVETGQVFSNLQEASDVFGLSRTSICRQLNGKQKYNLKGLTFEYAEDGK